MKAKHYRIELEENDLGQLLEGLEVRAESWEKTAIYFRSGNLPHGEFFVIEDCTDSEEAEAIAENYRAIIRKIRVQMTPSDE